MAVLLSHVQSKTADRSTILGFSLEDGAVGHRPGNVSIPNTEWFFLYKKDNQDPDIFSQRFVSRLYTDISLSYPEKSPNDPGPDDEYQVEELDDGWRYNVRFAGFSAELLLPEEQEMLTNHIFRALVSTIRPFKEGRDSNQSIH